MQRTRVLFLDIDGTLHPINRSKGVLSSLQTFEEVVRRSPAVEIVISSSWRTDHTLAELQSLFSPDIADRIIGVTPDRRTEFGVEPHQRQREIEDWMRNEGREYESWIAVDDADWMFEPGCRRLILVNPMLGFTQIEAALLAHRLTA